MNTESIIKEILTGIEDAFNELDLPKKPYGRNELWEGITNYFKIKQLRDKIEFYNSDYDYTSESITIAGFHEIPQETVENTIIPALEEQLTQMFFNPDFYYRFEYKLTLVFEFQFGLGRHIQKKLHLENPKRKAELKERLDAYVQKVIYDQTAKMKEKEIHSFFDKLFDFELNGYSEDKVIEILEKGFSLIDPKWKKTMEEYRFGLHYHTNEWKEAVFMPLYYNVKGEDWSKEYTLKKDLEVKNVDQAKLNLFVQQALWNIKHQRYSWDVRFACEDLERAAKELGSEKAAMYLKKGTGNLPENIIHYKDNDIECDANDVFATINVKIKQESATAYDKALDFIIALLKTNFPKSYQIKLSSKAPKQFLDIKGIAKNDLSNINKAGETKIQNLAKDAIDMENGENTVASHRDVNGVKTFKVDVKGDLANITSITGGANTGKVEFAGDQVVNVAGDNPIKLDAKTGDITGLTNKTLDGADFGKKGRAATEEQLKIVNDSKIGDNNIRLAGNSGKTADQKPDRKRHSCQYRL